MNTRTAQSNFTNSFINPCIEESNLTTKCLEKNHHNYTKCTLYFDNYNNCKKFWNSVRKARKNAGIRPEMPDPDERNYIRKELDKGNKVFSYQNNNK